MKKKIVYIVFLLIMSHICVIAQIIKVSNGLSLSSIKTEIFDLLDDNRYDYSGFIGLNYYYNQLNKPLTILYNKTIYSASFRRGSWFWSNKGT